ncbi:MAG TPA: DUF3106 domain-containing protein [Aquabacterium sp.]|nr:DUF3106 domain-containing protein [Aquabacterium sp.]
MRAALFFSAVCFLSAPDKLHAQPAAAPAKGAASAPSKGSATAAQTWASLTPAQRQALAPLEKDWPNIDAVRRAKWIEIATRLPSMPADERQRMQDRMTEWARLTPDERGRARMSFQEAKQLSPQERQARWEAYKALPEEDRKALANRAQDKRERPIAPAASAALSSVPKQTPPSGASAAVTVKPIAPTVVQAKPGATTTLMTKTPSPPAHQKPGRPKIEAQPDKVDRATLLPQRGPQGSGAGAAMPASAAASKG